jgi:GR25 family glycosyltransferase involved in LPS biosynthesis
MNLYDFFQDIVCINLDISHDRREHARYYFEKIGIPARFLTVKKHKNGGMYGCFDSHIQILLDAYKRDLDNILIFEDDFLPTDSYSEENLAKAVTFMQSNNDWDIFHLGYTFFRDNKDGLSTIFDACHETENIIQYNPFCTQALCYSRRAIKTIVENYHDYIGTMHYDMYISTFADLKNYCFIPMLFDQNFYFQHNNECTDAIEYGIRSLFPVIAASKINYRMTLLKYWIDKYKKYVSYMYLIIVSILLYIIKSQFILQKKNILYK